MRSGSRIAIVGAGIAGLVCAKVLTEDGFAVEVFDRAPDIGGVWSETRRYPGLRAQSTKNTYHFSDHPMPNDYPRVLDGARMQEYLSSYVRAFGLTDKLRLRTEVVAADPVEGGWLLEIRDADGVHRTSCDHLIIANGVFSEPEVPDFAGATEFARAGGQLGHSTQFLDVEAVRDRSVVVIGYGAAAGDLATEISRVAADTTVVARRLLWKMPRRLAAGLDAERVLLTRAGAAHFGQPEPGRFERLLHGPARSFRDSNLDLIEALVAQRSGAAELGLVPPVRFEQAQDGAFGLASEGFAEQVTQGRITVRGQTRVVGLGGGPAGPYAELSDGQRVRADIVVCATGFQQRVPFLTPYVQRQLTDDDGNFRLYRQILPLDVPHLTFAGYHTSLLSAVRAEIGAHWTAALLTGNLALPPAETMSERIDARLRWLDQHTRGRHTHGTVTPYAIRDIDELLGDLGVRLPLSARAAQWLRPVRPSDYRVVSRRKRGPGGQSATPAATDPAVGGPNPAPAPGGQTPAHPPTAPLAVAPVPVAQGAAPARPQLHDPVVPADSPTVRIPDAVAASAMRTAALPAVDPAARTRPVPEIRPPAPHRPPAVGRRPVPGPQEAAAPVPPPAPAIPPPPPAPVPGASIPPPAAPAVPHATRPAAGAPGPETATPRPATDAQAPVPPRSAAEQEAAAEAARRAAAEQRAAKIAARSNSATVRIDMRTAQPLMEGLPPANTHPAPGTAASGTPETGQVPPRAADRPNEPTAPGRVPANPRPEVSRPAQMGEPADAQDGIHTAGETPGSPGQSAETHTGDAGPTPEILAAGQPERAADTMSGVAAGSAPHTPEPPDANTEPAAAATTPPGSGSAQAPAEDSAANPTDSAPVSTRDARPAPGADSAVTSSDEAGRQGRVTDQSAADPAGSDPVAAEDVRPVSGAISVISASDAAGPAGRAADESASVSAEPAAGGTSAAFSGERATDAADSAEEVPTAAAEQSAGSGPATGSAAAEQRSAGETTAPSPGPGVADEASGADRRAEQGAESAVGAVSNGQQTEAGPGRAEPGGERAGEPASAGQALPPAEPAVGPGEAGESATAGDDAAVPEAAAERATDRANTDAGAGGTAATGTSRESTDRDADRPAGDRTRDAADRPAARRT